MKKLLIPAGLLVIAACSQEPVNVVFKGNQMFGRDSQQMATNSQISTSASTVAWSDRAAPSQIELRQEASAAPSRVSPVGVAELPPLLPQQERKPATTAQLAVIERDLSEIKLAPGSDSDAELEGARFTPAAVRVESPSGASEAGKSWYMGKIELTRAEVSDTPMVKSSGAPGFIWPVRGKIISNFGPKANGLHNDGINISAHLGDPVYAAADGVVVYAGNDLKGYGNMAIVRHQGGWMSAYAHADRLLVSENERVSQGQRIATVGATGSVDSAQLHFGLRNGKDPVDPAKFLSSGYAAMH